MESFTENILSRETADPYLKIFKFLSFKYILIGQVVHVLLRNVNSLTYNPNDHSAFLIETGIKTAIQVLRFSVCQYISFKGNFGYCPRASFLRRETGKVVWVPSFDHFQIRINTGFRYVYVWWIFPHFMDKIK